MSSLVVYADDNEDMLELMSLAIAPDDRFNVVCLNHANHIFDYLNFKDLQAVIVDMDFGVNLTGTIIVQKILDIRTDIPIAIYTSFPEDRIYKLLELIIKHYKESTIEVWNKSTTDVLHIGDKIEALIKKGKENAALYNSV
jgi:DNA-binding NtrC family response regulator